jgi:Ser/Thr protein kinase RdoA (MazF antagonist)
VTVDGQYRASGVLIERVGRPVSTKDFVSGFKKRHLFACLRALHILDIVHGDARLQNLVDLGVNNNTVLRWIDLGHNSRLTTELAVADFVTLLESYRGKKFANLI